MPNVLYDHSTGEIRARVFDNLNSPIVNATLVVSLYDSHLHPVLVFSNRAMPYSAGHQYTGAADLGCYFCTVSATELAGPDGLWKAVITATDTLANVLTINAYIEVTPFVAA